MMMKNSFFGEFEEVIRVVQVDSVTQSHPLPRGLH